MGSKISFPIFAHQHVNIKILELYLRVLLNKSKDINVNIHFQGCTVTFEIHAFK